MLGSFYRDGIDRGEKAAHIVDPENREEHLKRLAEAGIDVQKMMDTGQLEVVSLVEYEARLNHVLSKYDDPVICNYNPSKFGATVAMDIMRTHPLVIIGGLLRENPFFVPPEQFLDEMRERRSTRKTAA